MPASASDGMDIGMALVRVRRYQDLQRTLMDAAQGGCHLGRESLNAGQWLRQETPIDV
jgi:hypothetical protein